MNMLSDRGISFDDTFKAENHILSFVMSANKLISWMVKDFISREESVVLKIYIKKTLIKAQI